MKYGWFLLGVLAAMATSCSMTGKPEPERTAMVAPLVADDTNLADYVLATMEAAVAGKDPVADRALLLVHDDSTGRYVFNTNNPAFPFHGVTGISVRGNGANCGQNATLVAPRIVVTAGHCWQSLGSRAYYQDGQGARAQWRFLDRDGRVHYAYPRFSRLLTNTLTGRATDTRMFVLSNAMPPSVEPSLWGSPEMAAKAGGIAKLPWFVGTGRKRLWPLCSTVTNFAAWYEGLRGGDSGSGSFVPLGTNLVYIGSFGGDMTAKGVNWRETAEWLCAKFGYKASIPVEVDVSGFQ